MSLMTSAVLYVNGVHDQTVLTAPIPSDKERAQSFRPLTVTAAGGTKTMDPGTVLAACFNYLGPDQIIDWLESILGPHDQVALVYDVEGRPGSWFSPDWLRDEGATEGQR